MLTWQLGVQLWLMRLAKAPWQEEGDQQWNGKSNQMVQSINQAFTSTAPNKLNDW